MRERDEKLFDQRDERRMVGRKGREKVERKRGRRAREREEKIEVKFDVKVRRGQVTEDMKENLHLGVVHGSREVVLYATMRDWMV